MLRWPYRLTDDGLPRPKKATHSTSLPFHTFLPSPSRSLTSLAARSPPLPARSHARTLSHYHHKRHNNQQQQHRSILEDLVARTDSSATFRVAKTDGIWNIHATGESLMTWKFDPRTRSIEPTNLEAQNASRQQSRRDVISPVIHHASPVENATINEMSENEEIEQPEDLERTASVHSLVEELRTRRKQADLKPATAKGRASLPSWDEIVLGTTNSEPDSD